MNSMMQIYTYTQYEVNIWTKMPGGMPITVVEVNFDIILESTFDPVGVKDKDSNGLQMCSLGKGYSICKWRSSRRTPGTGYLLPSDAAAVMGAGSLPITEVLNNQNH